LLLVVSPHHYIEAKKTENKITIAARPKTRGGGGDFWFSFCFAFIGHTNIKKSGIKQWCFTDLSNNPGV
jgi:hypothetical protein